MKIQPGITLKLTVIFTLFAALILAGIGFLAYNSGQAALQAAISSELVSSGIEKQAALNKWVADRQYGVVALAQSPDIIRKIITLTSAQSGADEVRTAHDSLIEHLHVRAGEGQEYLELMLLQPVSAQVLVSTNPLAEGTFKDNLPYFINGKTGPFVQNLYLSDALNAPAMTVSAPVRTSDGQLVGVLAGRLHLQEMNAIIGRRTGLHETDDAFLVNADSLYATQPRFLSDPAVLLLEIHTAAVEKCLQGSNGVALYADYRDVPVLVSYRWMPERQLCLIVKLNQAEAFASTRAFGETIAVVGGITLLAAALLAYGLSNTITRPVRQLAQGAAQIGQGNLEFRIHIHSRDELGALGNEFNLMAGAIADKEKKLHRWGTDLELRVDERTAELSASEERFRKAIDAAPFPIMLHAEDGEIVTINQAWTQLTGYDHSQIPTMEQWILKAYGNEAQQEKADIDRLYSIEEPAREGEYAITTSRGETIIWDFSSAPIGCLPGGRRLVISMAMDVTWRKQAEEALLRQTEELKRSNAELERFAYVASHDLQEPLRMVTSYVQLLERRYKDKLDGDALEFIGYAVDGSNRMKLLINDLLAYSRVGMRGKDFHLVDCEEVLQHALANLKIALEESRAEVTHDSLPQIMADEVQLEQLFQNLIGNGLKFHGAEIPCIHIGLARKEKSWVFSVHDNGIGIDPQYFERIFIIFQRLHSRSKYEGTGIGLAVSKRIVERHGGQIWVESQPGCGSTFYFSMPVPGENQT